MAKTSTHLLSGARGGGRLGWSWIDRELRQADLAADAPRAMLLFANRLIPRVGGPMFLHLLYTLGFMRMVGPVEGALVVHRAGRGEVHRAGDKRADDTLLHMGTWVARGTSSAASARSLARVKSMHDHWGRHYAMSNATFLHALAFFTVQVGRLFALLGAPPLSDVEKAAQVAHWRGVGEGLGIEDVPRTWEDFERVLDDFEASDQFTPTPEGMRCARAFIEQFERRWFPRGLRWLGRLLVLSLHEDHVLSVLGLTAPPSPVRRTLRALLRLGLWVNVHLLADRRSLVDPGAFFAAGAATAGAHGR
jgi:hypothetical protein